MTIPNDVTVATSVATFLALASMLGTWKRRLDIVPSARPVRKGWNQRARRTSDYSDLAWAKMAHEGWLAALLGPLVIIGWRLAPAELAAREWLPLTVLALLFVAIANLLHIEIAAGSPRRARLRAYHAAMTPGPAKRLSPPSGPAQQS